MCVKPPSRRTCDLVASPFVLVILLKSANIESAQVSYGMRDFVFPHDS
jgi:hypothetical protein